MQSHAVTGVCSTLGHDIDNSLRCFFRFRFSIREHPQLRGRVDGAEIVAGSPSYLALFIGGSFGNRSFMVPCFEQEIVRPPTGAGPIENVPNDPCGI